MSVSVAGLVVAVAAVHDAPAMVEVIHAAFGARPPLDPPSTAVDETAASVRSMLHRGGGIYAHVDERPAGVILVLPGTTGEATFQRVSVHPDFQRHGIASAMVSLAEELAADLGHERVELFARGEFAELIAYWQHRGYATARPAPHGVILAKDLPLRIEVPTADAMRQLGVRLSALLRAGDLIIATGALGAGKTTLAQGLGAGLGSRGPIISPTFVLSRVHPSTTGRPTLLHVDAYRLRSAAELDDLDLDSSVPDAVTVVEWGAGLAESLADDRLELTLNRQATETVDAGTEDQPRLVTVRGVGPRWRGVDLSSLRQTVDA